MNASMKCIFQLFVIILCCSLPHTLPAQKTTFDQILQDEFPSDGPGATAIVAKGKQILYLGAVGMADMELNVVMQPGNVLRLGSITKQFTAVCILKLIEEGKINLQDDMTKFLPDYPTKGKTITVEHLLTHTSGIQSYTEMPGFMQEQTRKDLEVGALIDVFKNEPMQFDPGEQWAYNNSGYILLGAIIEKVSGKTYEEYVIENIFKPLQMNNSHYGSNIKLIPNRATGYSKGEDGYMHANYLSMTIPYAAGSLVSTVEDVLKWNHAIFDGKIISMESLKKAHTPYVLNDGNATNYGYGWLIDNFMGAKNITHGGGIFGYLTQGIYLPEEEIYVAVFSNCDCKSPNSAANRLAAVALGKSLEFTQVKLEASELKEYTGVYQIEDSEDKRSVFVEDERIFTQRNDGQVFEIIPFGKDQFYYADSRTTIIFNRDDYDQISGHTMMPVSEESSFAKRTTEAVKKTEFIDVPGSVVQNYLGSYEIAPNFILEIRLEDGKLIGQATGQGPIEMKAISENEFVNQQVGAKIVFEKTDGPSSFLTLFQGGGEIKAERVKD